MSRVVKRLALAAFLAAGCGAGLFAAAPRWLIDEAKLPARATVSEQGAEILRNDLVVTVDEEGTWREEMHYAMRVEHAGGVEWAYLAAPYVEKADKVLRAEAWLMRNGKSVQTFGRREWVDQAAIDNAVLYSDFRQYGVACRTAASGDVFGGELIVQRTSNVGQGVISFSQPLAARVQRVEIHVPKGWQVKWQVLNGAEAAPRVSADNTTWTWEVLNAPAEKSEIWASEQPSRLLALTIDPPAGKRPAALPAMGSWADVAQWLYGIQNPQSDSTPALVETARRLTAGLDDPWKKLEAITRFAGDRRYIQVNRNNGLGFGYRPRKASEVLAADYGDCKDKSNLLRSLLREAGFKSHLVAAYIGDQDALRPGWPSPTQFNHAILMIELPPAAAGHAMLNDPVFGPVVFFDSTARWIPAGHLPWVLQGGRGLVCEPRATGLVEFPRAPGDAEYQVTSRITLDLTADGTLAGEIQETTQGQLAALARSRVFELSEKEQKENWLRRLNATVRGVSVESIAHQAAPDLWRHESTIKFRAPGFGQNVREEMLVLNLDVLTRDSVPVFPDKPRTRPLLVRPIHTVSETSINLPAKGRAELPAPRELRSEFGHYTGAYRAADGRITYRRTLELNAGRIAPERYTAFRQFLLDVAKAERTAVIVHLDGGK